MSLCEQGLDTKVRDVSITIHVSASESLPTLANALDWVMLATLVMPDLKKTARGFWHVGRRLWLRSHLAVMILQSLRKETDRGIEVRINETPVLQAFCGYGILPNWKCPDHTKVEEFRNRLSDETHKAVADYVVQLAQKLGFADASWMDIDSTVQQANIAYPSDATLMKKLSEKVHRVIEFIKGKTEIVVGDLTVGIEGIRKLAHGYFFMAKNTAIEKRREAFAKYHETVTQQLTPVMSYLATLGEKTQAALPWNIRATLNQITTHGSKYLSDVLHFAQTHTMKAGKILSFHAQQVACIKKGKAGKEHEFGRVFQLGRIGGNFLIVAACNSVRMEDKTSLMPMIAEHRRLFGKGHLKQAGTDKGYYTAKNVKDVESLGINADGVQRPCTVKQQLSADVVTPLRNRRAGIEPLIQHAKLFGLGKSKMKSDATTLASGYRSVTAFNLHQLHRHMVKAA
jgi:hypothetical protein